jgi:MFS family permease
MKLTLSVSKEKGATQEIEGEETISDRIERMGRERPPIFSTLLQEVAFVFSITMSQILTEYLVSGFNVILPRLITDLHIPSTAAVWPASAFSLVIASTLLVWGRLSDMWGGYPIYLFGLAWLVVWSIAAGFSTNPLMLDFTRALQGLGAAAFLPSGVMLMGSVYRPGPRKNLVFALYGTCAVVGFYVGVFSAGFIGQFIHWGWYFWIGALLAALTLATSIVAIPNDSSDKRKNGVTMDWLGAGTIVSGLILLVFAITESSHAPHGWATPYIPTLLVVGLLLLGAAIYIEGHVATLPLLPLDIFAVRHMTPLILALLLLYGNIGIFLLYGTQYFEIFMGATPLKVVAWYVPMVLGGLILSTGEGFVLHIVPGRALLLISSLGAIGSQLLLALVPVGGPFWAWIFPAMILCTIGIDLAINVTTVFVTTQLPSSRQGLAGGLINSVLQLGMAFALGLADVVQTATVARVGLRSSYKAIFWLAVAFGGLSLLLILIWGDIPKATSDLTADEKRELEREATREHEEARTI